MDLKTIRKRLRELTADPGQPGATAEVQRLRGALARARRKTTTAVTGKTSSDVDQMTDAEAIKTWPPALRARASRGGAYGRVIDGSGREDPDGHGQRNDLRRRGTLGL